jgi:hypothetical protein
MSTLNEITEEKPRAAGRVTFDGRDVTCRPSHRLIARGLAPETPDVAPGDAAVALGQFLERADAATGAPHSRRVIVLHGHRHKDWIGVCGNLVLCSAPSTSLGGGSADNYRGSFHLHQLAVETDGGIRLKATERVRV